MGLLVALGVRFFEADKLDHAESALERAALLVEAGGHASLRDTVMLHWHLAEIEHRRRAQRHASASPAGGDAVEPGGPT